MSISSSRAHERRYLKRSSPQRPPSRARRFPGSSVAQRTSALIPCSGLPMRSRRPFRNSFFPVVWIDPTRLSLSAVHRLRDQNSSKPTRSWPHSMKPRVTRFSDIVKPADQRWRVEVHAKVADAIGENGGPRSNAFRPRIAEVFESLAHDPKRFPKKQGKLSSARSVKIVFSGRVAWRMVYAIDERCRSVHVLSLAPHDKAYLEAERRI